MADDEERSPDERELEQTIRAKEENKWLLLSKPNVIGLDVGFRLRGGRILEERVVKVYVRRKVEKKLLADEDLIPRSVVVGDQEVGVDVEAGTIDSPHLFTLRARPLRGGSSIGVPGGGTGTLGICVTLNDGNTYVLSNNHVIAAGNGVGTGVLQPSVGDGGTAANDSVATLSNFVPIDFGSTTITILGITITIPNPNFVDAALAQVTNVYNDGNREIHWIGYPHFLREGNWNIFQKLGLLNRRVCKMGRTTEFTVGRIISVTSDRWIGPYWNGQNAWFENQIRIEGESGPFSRPGDSGSLVVDFETRQPIGLLFSGGGNFTNANPLDDVLDGLGIPQL